MIDINSPELSFRTEKEVEGYAKFFLSVSPIDARQEFETAEEVAEFNTRREALLKAQLHLLRSVDLAKANANKVENAYYKIVKKAHKEPLSSSGSNKSSSRFNYKDNPLLKNRVVYFGKTKKCCEIEKFHLEYEREIIKKAFDKDYVYQDGEIRFAEHVVKQYRISIENILIVTSKPSLDGIGISPSAFMNEWYDLNEEYEIPTSSQILGTIARVHGFKGILYKSTRYQLESNLVIFEENTGEIKFTEIDEQAYIPSQEIIEGNY